ncbi:MAG: hypothetical protein JSR93_09895 [Verrucomicrobia bacterium]|nr:hypothetical protein [Verrucomicrobiota bacterium]
MASERPVSYSYANQGANFWPPYNPWLHVSYQRPVLVGRTFISVQESWENIAYLVPGSLQKQHGKPAAYSSYRPQYSHEEVTRLPLVVLLSTADALKDTLPKEHHSSFHLELAQIALCKKVDEVAESYFQKAVANGSKNPGAWLSYANFLDACGRKRECLEVLQEGFRFCPESNELLESILLKEIQVSHVQSH